MKLNIFCGNTLEIDLEKTFKIKKFDVVIGNPPYVIAFENMTNIAPIYNLFIEYYLQKSQILSFVIPSRFFSGGKGLDKFRNMFMNRNDIYSIQHFEDSQQIFGKSIFNAGGINYFIIDQKQIFKFSLFNNKKYKLNYYDIIVTKPQFFNIINFVKQFKSLEEMYTPHSYFNIKSNDKRLQIQKENENFIKCFVTKTQNYIKYIDKNLIKNKENFWKVLVQQLPFNLAGGKLCGFKDVFICSNEEVSSQTYMIFKVENKDQAIFFTSYLKCKLPNFMLTLRKTQLSIEKKSVKWIPQVPLDRIWTDKKVYEYFKIPADMQKQIEDEEIKGFKKIDESLSEDQLFELFSRQPQQIVKEPKKKEKQIVQKKLDI